MNIINTVAPIAIQDLKQYFTDKTTFYHINYAESTLKSSKLLVYLSNLDLPCDLIIDQSSEEFKELMIAYLHHPLLVNIPSLENAVITMLLESKGLGSFGYSKFISDNIDIITKWVNVLDSMTLYNLYTINSPELKEFVISHPLNDTSSTEGINFVSLLKNQRFYDFYLKVAPANLYFYKNYFELNMFKGSNLYAFWATDANPMFLLTYGIAEGLVNSDKYTAAKITSIKELQDATPI
jgi:hypothetical protein